MALLDLIWLFPGSAQPGRARTGSSLGPARLPKRWFCFGKATILGESRKYGVEKIQKRTAAKKFNGIVVIQPGSPCPGSARLSPARAWPGSICPAWARPGPAWASAVKLTSLCRLRLGSPEHFLGMNPPPLTQPGFFQQVYGKIHLIAHRQAGHMAWPRVKT